MKTLEEIEAAGWLVIKRNKNKWFAQHSNGHEYTAKTKKQLLIDVSCHPMFHLNKSKRFN
jgi:hypothetical protein